MSRTARRATRIAAVAAAAALAACGSTADDQTVMPPDTGGATASATMTTTSAAQAGAQAGASGYTIVDYIRDHDIDETTARPGDPGAPNVSLPTPPGWSNATDRAPGWAWAALVSGDPAVADDPPSIVVLMSKLTGDVDADRVLEFAPAELRNLPGFDGGAGTATTLSGFDAVQIGGRYDKDGVERVVGQKTVVIPAADAVYLMQLNADAPAEHAEQLLNATRFLDEQTRITF